MFGLYDTKTNCWLGNHQGPLLYEDETLAQCAARILDVRLKQPAGRTRATPFHEESVVKKDDITPEISAEEAMRRLEEGLTL